MPNAFFHCWKSTFAQSPTPPDHLLLQGLILRLCTAQTKAAAATPQPTALLASMQHPCIYRGDLCVCACTRTHAHRSQKTLPQHNHFWCHKGHFKMNLKPQGPSELSVTSWSKVLESLGIQAHRDEALFTSVSLISD